MTTANDLERWEAAWGGAPDVRPFFGAALLDRESIAVLAQYEDGRVVAGAVANRSATVIGLSNVFDRRGDLAAAWSGAANAARSHWGRMAVVGYDSGPALDAAHAAGFLTIGELTVSVRR